MRLSRKKSVTITDNITIPSQVLTAKEYDQSIGSMNNPAASSNKSHFHDEAIAKSAHTAKLRMLSKRAKRKSKKSILKNGSTSKSSSTATTTKQKEVQGVKNSNKPKASSNGASKASTTTPTTTNTTTTAAASTMSITVNGKPILNIEPSATPEDVQTFLNTLQCGLNYELEQQKKTKKITNDDDDNDEEDIQDILPSSTSETEASEASDVELDDILPATTSETEASQEDDGEIKLGPRATQKFEQMEKDMDAEVSLYDDKLGKSLRTLLEMKSKMSAACGPMDPEEEEKETDKAQEGVEELVSQVAQVVENVQETITDASKEVQSLIFPEVSIQESSTTVGSSFEGESTTLSDKSWKKELNGYRLTGQTSDIRLNTTNDDISVDPSIETIENEGDILIGFDHHVRTGVVKEDEKKSLVDPYQMSLMLDGVAVQSLTLGAAAMKMINDMISDAKGNVTTDDVLNGSAEQEQLEIDLKNSLSVEGNEVLQVQAPSPPAEEQDTSFIHPLILEKLNSFVEQAMVNIEQAKASTITNIEQAKTATISTITSTSEGIQKAWREENRNDNLSFERSTSEDDRDYSIDAHINF